MKKTTNKFAGTCHNCGRLVKAGDGVASRAPGMRSWKVECGPYGCVDRSYSGAQEDPSEREARLEVEEELDNKRRAAETPYGTDEDLRMEHGSYGRS